MAPRAVQPQPDESAAPPELMAEIDAALRDPHPLAMLLMASGIMESLRPPRHHLPGDADDPPALTVAAFCEALDGAGLRQTDALLKVIATLTPDQILAGRIRRSVASRRHALPGWVLRLDQTRPGASLEFIHVLRDGDNVVIGVDLPGNRQLTLMVYIDHNLGTLVKDAFAIDRGVEEVVESWEKIAEDDSEVRQLSAADARTRILDAIEMGSITVPPFENDSWPACRPLVEWVVSMLPTGGTGYLRPDWSEKQLAALTRSFFDSTFGRPLDDEDHRGLFESLLWFGTDCGPGDPLRWSPVNVEILLDDWIPRKIVAPVEYLTQAPELLRAFIRYAHTERGISAALTDDTLDAVDLWEPEYQKAIRSPRLQGPMALLERAGLLGGREMGDDLSDLGLGDLGLGDLGLGSSPDAEEFYEKALATQLIADLAGLVGGHDALDRLDDTPLPDEAFDRTGIPEGILARVEEIGALVDGCSEALFDLEFRTASRRLLARVARAEPALFRGRGAPRGIAAGICWVIGKANDRFVPATDVRVKDLTTWFGVTGSHPKRAEPLLVAIGADPEFGGTVLGDACLLDAETRAEIIDLRDAFLEADTL